MPPDHELLDIAETAAFLRVSETSLRRWTNAGILPCFRIGGRRERRFRRADLLEFLERSSDPGPSVGGGHACALYTSPSERRRLAGEFLARGLEIGSTCFLAGEPAVRREVLAWVKENRSGALEAPGHGALFMDHYGEVTREQLTSWRSAYQWALGTGNASLCAVGDVMGAPFALRGPFDELVDYEREYDRTLARSFPVTTLCLYDARRLTGVQAARIVDAHGGRAGAATFPTTSHTGEGRSG